LGVFFTTGLPILFNEAHFGETGSEGASYLQKLLTDIVQTVVKDDVNFEIQRE
jgi:hypothetical protein